MRSFWTVFLILVAGFNTFAGSSIVVPPRIDTGSLIQDDRFVPFPWSVSQPMSRTVMEGTWYAENGDFSSYFSLEDLGSYQYKVKQVDPVTCRVVASGYGTMSRSTKTFSAQMNYVKFNSPYRFMIRAYNYTTAEKARGLELYPVNGQVLVISIQGNSREDYVHMPLTKESNEAASITCKSRK